MEQPIQEENVFSLQEEPRKDWATSEHIAQVAVESIQHRPLKVPAILGLPRHHSKIPRPQPSGFPGDWKTLPPHRIHSANKIIGGLQHGIPQEATPLPGRLQILAVATLHINLRPS